MGTVTGGRSRLDFSAVTTPVESTHIHTAAHAPYWLSCVYPSVAVQFPVTFLQVCKLFQQCHHQLEIGKKTCTIKSPLVINNVNGESSSSCCLLLLLCSLCVFFSVSGSHARASLSFYWITSRQEKNQIKKKLRAITIVAQLWIIIPNNYSQLHLKGKWFHFAFCLGCVFWLFLKIDRIGLQFVVKFRYLYWGLRVLLLLPFRDWISWREGNVLCLCVASERKKKKKKTRQSRENHHNGLGCDCGK